MHHEHSYGERRFGPPGFGRRRHFMRPFPSREELIERLESYQRDLEQELANLDDVLRHLRGSAAPSSEESHEG
jgi:hypothetical protein